MARQVIATVDAVSAEVLREAFADAAIDADFHTVRSGYRHQAWYRNQTAADMRPLVDVAVDDADTDAARELLARIEREVERDLDQQALEAAPEATPAAPPLPARPMMRALALAGVAFLVAVVVVALSMLGHVAHSGAAPVR